MVNLDYKRGENFRFRIQYEVRPEIKLKEYKGIAVEKAVHKVTESEVDQRILNLRRSSSPLVEVESATDQEHVVTGDVQELDPGGVPIIGRRSKGMRFYLADENLTDEIKKALGSARTGETYRVRFEPAANEDRKALDIDIAVTKAEKRVMPEFDESFISTMTKGTATSPEEFRANLRVDLEKYWDDWSRRKLADAVTSHIVKDHDFPVPDSLVRTS
jgi:trigger factor